MFALRQRRFLSPFYLLLAGQFAPAGPQPSISIPLTVEAGTPIRLYITRRLRYRVGRSVEAKVIAPVWVYDRVVIPEGSTIEGQVASLESVPKMIRATAMVRGDFTPLKNAQVIFHTLALPDGRKISLDALASKGLASIYLPPRPPKQGRTNVKQPGKSTPDRNPRMTKMRVLARQQAERQINGRTYGFLDFVRAPNKREWLENLMWSKLPYHPQWYKTGTRFDSVLRSSLQLGTVQLTQASFQQVSLSPTPDVTALVRLTTTTTSADARLNDPIGGILSAPLFGPDHALVLPQGTRLYGRVTLAKSARLFHKGGQLRFSFDRMEPPAVLPAPPAAEPERVQTQVTAVEQRGHTVAVDAEGTAKATESKTRFLRPVIAGLIAAQTLDNDEGRQTASGGGTGNGVGRSLGGFSGFGILGTVASQGPRPIGTALGFYGLAWSVYSSVVARGQEVTFEKNSEVSIRFGAQAGSRRAGGH